MKVGAVRAALLSVAIMGLVFAGAAPSQGQAGEKISASTIPSAQLIQPAELNKILQGPASARPLVLQVGFRMMYQEAHIAGAEYAGPGATAGDDLDAAHAVLRRLRQKPLQRPVGRGGRVAVQVEPARGGRPARAQPLPIGAVEPGRRHSDGDGARAARRDRRRPGRCDLARCAWA